MVSAMSYYDIKASSHVLQGSTSAQRRDVLNSVMRFRDGMVYKLNAKLHDRNCTSMHMPPLHTTMHSTSIYRKSQVALVWDQCNADHILTILAHGLVVTAPGINILFIIAEVCLAIRLAAHHVANGRAQLVDCENQTGDDNTQHEDHQCHTQCCCSSTCTGGRS